MLVISPLQEPTIAQAAQTPGHALQVGVQRKLAANLSACRYSGTDFVPLVAETLGGLAEDTIRIITNISRAIENRCGTSDSTPTTSHLFGRLAVALWRDNASLWLHCLPTIPPLPGRFSLTFLYISYHFVLKKILPQKKRDKICYTFTFDFGPSIVPQRMFACVPETFDLNLKPRTFDPHGCFTMDI